MSTTGWRGGPEPPMAGDEVATMLGSLERQRATFAWKCGGVDAEGMRARIGASSLRESVDGLVGEDPPGPG